MVLSPWRRDRHVFVASPRSGAMTPTARRAARRNRYAKGAPAPGDSADSSPSGSTFRALQLMLCSCARHGIGGCHDLTATCAFDGFDLPQILHDASEIAVQRCGKGFARGPNVSHDGITRDWGRGGGCSSVLIGHVINSSGVQMVGVPPM